MFVAGATTPFLTEREARKWQGVLARECRVRTDVVPVARHEPDPAQSEAAIDAGELRHYVRVGSTYALYSAPHGPFPGNFVAGCKADVRRQLAFAGRLSPHP